MIKQITLQSSFATINAVIRKAALPCVLAVVAALSAGSAFGQAGIFAGTVGVSSNGNPLAWYPLVSESNNGPGVFNGANLGTFNISMGQTLSLGGAEGLIFKHADAGADVTGVSFDYLIYATGSRPASPVFSIASRDFTSESGDGSGSINDANGNMFSPGAGFVNQKWANNPGGSSIPLNLLTGLGNGNYTLEVFFSGSTNGAGGAGNPIFLNNGGSNYLASFTVVPEPATISLLAGPALLGAWFFARRRRS